MPSVRDQVAFMAFLVLLAPGLDSQLENFVFGNRWYRPIRWDRRIAPPGRWKRGPFPLLTSQAYLPYARSHGLYRRVAHWTVARMTKATIPDRDYGGALQQPDHYDEAWLPRWTRELWWNIEAGGEASAYWATLDLQLAYPSVRLARLRDGICGMSVAAPVEEMSGFPGSVCDALACQEVLQFLGNRLVDALEQVRVRSGDIPKDAWRPCCALPELPPEGNQGLPIGLAISGFLMNVVLHAADSELLGKLERGEGSDRRAVLRFADDMTLFSRSVNGLLGLVDDVWGVLAGDDSIALASGRASPSNLYLNLDKVGPPELKELVSEYLVAHGWKKKRKSCDKLRRPGESGAQGSVRKLSDWLRSLPDDQDSLAAALRRTAVGPNEVGPFVTTLVARLSELGTDTLAERFGDGARRRLERLHELARFDIDDRQVRPDTRRAFAANRLVRVWLPSDRDAARADLSEIRESIAYVFRETPWKFSLWRAVVRAAALRPVCACGEDDSLAEEWLSDRLRHIAHVEGDGDSSSWMNTWPEDLNGGRHDRDPLWKAQYLSFLRAAFWHHLGDVLRALWGHHDRVENPRVGDAGPPPSWWTLRAIPDGRHGDVASLLGAVDKWAAVLYPPGDFSDRLKQWPWELDELVAAVLASRDRRQVARSLRRSDRPDGTLMAPRALLADKAPRTIKLLAGAGRLLPSRSRARDLNESGLAHVYLAGRHAGLATCLFPAGRKPRILKARRDPDHTVSAGVALGCEANIERDLLRKCLFVPAAMARKASRDPLALREYGRARLLLLGHDPGGS